MKTNIIKYIKTAQMTYQGTTNGGILYLLPNYLMRVFYVIPLLLLWKTLMNSGTENGMTLSQMLSYSYLGAIFSDLLVVYTPASNWLYEAVNISGVTKIYEQWQRTGSGKNILKNLINPEKKIVKALDNISFQERKGEFAAYAGPNGAGKSTTMKLLCGMLVPGEVPQLACGRLVSENSGICEYEVDIGKTTIKSVLSEIAAIDGVADIEIKKAPIEMIIAGLYSSWNGSAKSSGVLHRPQERYQ